MRLFYSERFQRAYADLEDEQVKLVKKALRLLTSDPRHPSLRVKKMQGTADIWEARASRSLRLTFEMRGDVILLRNVGAHNETLGHP
jgi:mRNA-degrading endonuclease YafQ of YafQ-DinJ toxin-antitoxin module